MFARFTHAIVRPPGRTFAGGLTTVDRGAPDLTVALQQHAAYRAALARHGCTLVELPADDRFPDSTFVEDTALILTGLGAILTRPGAESRVGEVEAIGLAIAAHVALVSRMVAPGTLDAGDVCDSGREVFIGTSQRTNVEGARQLAAWLKGHERSSRIVDIRAMSGLLHLKSGVTAVGDGRLLAIDALAGQPAFAPYDVVRVPAGEAYAANCVRINNVVFVAAGFPHTHALLRDLGYTLEVLDMSEFAKMDGGLSCLSLRW